MKYLDSYFLLLPFLFLPFVSFSQFSFGVKAGANIDSKNNITAYIASIDNNINIYLSRGGINYGGFTQYEFPDFFIKAEYNHTQIQNNHVTPYILVRTDEIIENYTINKLEIPLIAGYKVTKTINVFAGYKLFNRSDQNFKNIEIEELRNISKSKLLFGFGLHFTNFNFDLRFEPAPENTSVLYLDQSINEKTQYIKTEGSYFVLTFGINLYSLLIS